MENKRKSSYPFAIFLSVLSFLIAIFGVIYAVAVVAIGELLGFDLTFGHPEKKMVLAATVGIISVLQYITLRLPLHNYVNKAILDNEYDEFGRSKKKKFENLTRAEREQMDLQKAALMEQLLSSSVLKRITKRGSEHPEADLKKMIGLEEVKGKILELNARMKFEKSTRKGKRKFKGQYGANGRHFVFYGNPGTGKTVCARIIAGFLYENGYIRQNKVIEINGGFLKAGEDSETKTKLVIQQAYGGVLFIDEAYSIVEGNVNYGRAVIAELIKEMEDNRDKFTVILAGYKKDMKRLLDENEGFKSRIKEYFEFKDYDISELKLIFQDMAHEAGYAVSIEAMDNFEVRMSKEKLLPTFGNGRTVRNVLDESIDKHALNYGMGKLSRTNGMRIEDNETCKFVLCGCDIDIMPNKNVL